MPGAYSQDILITRQAAMSAHQLEYGKTEGQ